MTSNTQISITFNTAMDTASARSAISSVPPITGSFTWTAGNTSIVWRPDANLTGNTAYTVKVAASAHSSGNLAMLRDTAFTFTTVPDSSTSVPLVVSSDPADHSINVAYNSYVTLVFNVATNPSLTQAAITSIPAIAGTFSWDNGDTRMTWIPTSDLKDTTMYTITLTTAAQSKAGIAMAANKSITFTTGHTTRPPTRVMGSVLRKEDSGAVRGANVVLYNASTNSPLLRTTSGYGGAFEFKVDSGDYYLTATATGRIPAPPPWGRASPFHVAMDSTKVRNIYMRRDSSGDTTGGISGTILISGGTTSAAGILVIATRSDSIFFSTTTGPDGYYVFYNLPIGTYTISVFRSGLAQDSLKVTTVVVRDSVIPNLSLSMLVDPGRRLDGKITYLATKNGIVDITLVDPGSRTAIPGLRTFNTGGLNYSLGGIPPGTYIAWASYLNDGYVMDPDAIRKFGLPLVTFAAKDSLKNLSFDVTGAITILRPTNPPERLTPAPVNTLTPYFVWDSYSSTKQYIIEVLDQSGARIWGGWDSTGKILHAPILAHGGGLDSVQFNFDGSALEPLKMRQTYSWKVYADFFNRKDVGQLISSSEDLRGLFMAGVDSIPDIDTIYYAP